MAMVGTMKNKPPPSIGWWPTGEHRVRWWNGEYWSWVCFDSDNMHAVAAYGNRADKHAKNVQWYPRPDSWPERSKT
jgi:hypothetical protein